MDEYCSIERSDPDYPHAGGLNEVVCRRIGERLFLKPREEKGLAPNCVYRPFVARKYAGPWTAGGDHPQRSEPTER